MAASLSNVRMVELGGGLRLITGNFAITLGSASLSYAAVGTPVFYQVIPLSTTSAGTTTEPQDPTALGGTIAGLSVSGAITTLTIYGNASITNGQFSLIVSIGG